MARKKKDEEIIEPKFTLYQKIVLFILTLIVIIGGLGFYARYIGTTKIESKEVKIVNQNLPSEYHGFKIVQLTDVHYNTTITKKELNQIVDKINAMKPDIVVLTGDLFDKNTTYEEKDFTDISETLAKIDALIGKYAITGNHDTKFTEWETVIKNSGFQNFNDKYELLYKESYAPILLAGVSSNLNDTKNIQDKMKPTLDYMNTIKKSDEGSYQYAILLMHEPDYITEIDYEKFDLALAGHSHHGQVRLPFLGAVVTPKGAKKYYNEHYNIDGTELYISNGLGTSTSPYRFLNRPSITLYRLETQ